MRCRARSGIGEALPPRLPPTAPCICRCRMTRTAVSSTRTPGPSPRDGQPTTSTWGRCTAEGNGELSGQRSGLWARETE
eukprot:scaffold7062_cov79-Isochrysis_galbana.AAC.1